MLGALLTAVSHGLAQLPNTRLAGLPRMADFALWATACETAIWESGTFQAAYSGNLDDATANVIDADPVAAAVRGLMSAKEKSEGTATELMAELALVAGDRISRAKTWPDNPRSLSGRLRRAAPLLRKVGTEIAFPTGHHHGRFISITRPPLREAKFASPSSPSSPHRGNSNSINGLSMGTQKHPGRPRPSPDGDAIVPASSHRPRIVPPNLLKNKDERRGDDGDGKIPALSAPPPIWKGRI